MIGLWDKFHAEETHPYGNPDTYRLAADWLNGFGLIEDWGCGRGYFKQFVKGDYFGIDGSGTFAGVRANLASRKSQAPCILLRHVLEHNIEWRKILVNLLDSFTCRAVIVSFIPLQEKEHILGWENGIPNIALPREEFMQMILPYLSEMRIEGDEVLYYLVQP